ncbi:MAG: TadE/TadG family type IV pilus assembly protein [Actinomycetota bacterium]
MSRPAGARRRAVGLLRDERGDVAPTVILAPLTIFLVMFVVQMGLFFHARTVLNAAAQDATRAVQLENATATDGRAAADAVLSGSEGFLTVTGLAIDDGETVEVVITADVVSLVPFWSGSTSAAASGPKEFFRPEDER